MAFDNCGMSQREREKHTWKWVLRKENMPCDGRLIYLRTKGDDKRDGPKFTGCVIMSP